MNWANITRAISIVALLALGTAHIGFDALANPPHINVYLFLGAVALGVDVKALRELILRILGGSGDKK